MQKTILITGSTDGIGLETAKMLAQKGHQVLLHGRDPQKLERTKSQLTAINSQANLGGYVADLSDLSQVEKLAQSVRDDHPQLDVLINNAGVFKTTQPITGSGLDVRFAVNAIAPYLLTQRLLPLFGKSGRESGRVINVSSAAQIPVDLLALTGELPLVDMEAYGQSKLALIMWGRVLASSLQASGPAIISVNPGSMLGTKMVREGFGVAGGDVSQGATALSQLALSDEFADASGKYFDNDLGRIGSPHPDALDPPKCEALVKSIEALIA